MSNDTWKPSDGLREITNDVIVGLLSHGDREDAQELKWRFDDACGSLDGNVALMRDENIRLRAALNAYRSALLSGEKESDQLRQLADEALREIDTWEEWGV